MLRTALVTGHASASQIAALFAMPSWTLTRRLKSYGVGFQQLVDETQSEIARQMLEYSEMDVSQIAALLDLQRERLDESLPALDRYHPGQSANDEKACGVDVRGFIRERSATGLQSLTREPCLSFGLALGVHDVVATASRGSSI